MQAYKDPECKYNHSSPTGNHDYNCPWTSKKRNLAPEASSQLPHDEHPFRVEVVGRLIHLV